MVVRIHLKHAREPAAVDEGKFFLVARIWPRGVSKEELQLAARLKEVVPSTTLRRRDLNESGSLPGAPRERKNHPIGYGAYDEEHNNAVVLREFLSR